MLQWNAAAARPDRTPRSRRRSPARSRPSRRRPARTGRFTHIHGLGLGLNKNAENKEGAVKFLNWLATRGGDARSTPRPAARRR